jgi:hypothetical protein
VYSLLLYFYFFLFSVVVYLLVAALGIRSWTMIYVIFTTLVVESWVLLCNHFGSLPTRLNGIFSIVVILNKVLLFSKKQWLFVIRDY